MVKVVLAFSSNHILKLLQKKVADTQTFSLSCTKKAVKVAKPAIRHFSKLPQKKAVKVAKLAIRHFSKLPQKKPEKVAKPAFRHFFPSCPKKGGKAGETGFTAFTAFFSASFEKSLSTKKNRLYRFYRLFFARV